MIIFGIVVDAIFGVGCLFTAFILAVSITTGSVFFKWIDVSLMMLLIGIGAVSVFKSGVMLGKYLAT